MRPTAAESARDVVWRPRESLSRTSSFVFSTPSSVLVSVDLPAPDEPTSTTLCPGCSHGSSAATLSRSFAFTATTATACPATAAASRAASTAPGESASAPSAFVSTTTGSTPPLLPINTR